MTAHVVYEAIDPKRPATTSPRVVNEVIRGEIGFEGLLMSDDLSMKALDGPLATRAKAAQFAGCDIVLHCNGSMDEMRDVAKEAKPLEGLAPEARRRGARPSRGAGGFRCGGGRSEARITFGDESSMSEFVDTFEEMEAHAAPPEERAGRDGRRLRRPARSSARAGAQPEGRHRQDFGPEARRPISRIHRAGEAVQSRARGRLSRDGGVARLSQIAADAAAAAMRRTASRRRTKWRRGCAGACSGSTPCARPRPVSWRATVSAAKSSAAARRSP